MRSVTISSENVASREQLFEVIKKGFALPQYCGHNLDAIYDCLGDIFEEFEINVRIDDQLRNALGEYLESFVSLLSDLDDENPNLILNIDFGA